MGSLICIRSDFKSVYANEGRRHASQSNACVGDLSISSFLVLCYWNCGSMVGDCRLICISDARFACGVQVPPPLLLLTTLFLKDGRRLPQYSHSYSYFYPPSTSWTASCVGFMEHMFRVTSAVICIWLLICISPAQQPIRRQIKHLLLVPTANWFSWWL